MNIREAQTAMDGVIHSTQDETLSLQKDNIEVTFYLSLKLEQLLINSHYTLKCWKNLNYRTSEVDGLNLLMFKSQHCPQQCERLSDPNLKCSST
uniref:Uncharacterized protein n=1 Tax=Onchocerca volvulus TaxID=6282 RepID=A0A044V4I5_ONCVO